MAAATGTICEIYEQATLQWKFGVCQLDNLGTGTTGDDCGAMGAPCRWGPVSCVAGVCAEPCGTNAHCPSGYHCSLLGNSVDGATLTSPPEPPYVGGEPATMTVPACLADGPGAHDRLCGAACSQNGDCVGELCEATLGVCVDLCTSDASCPSGLVCVQQYVRTVPGPGNPVVLARVCVNEPVAIVLEPL